MSVLQSGKLIAYDSQFGLQGKVFRHIARYLSGENIVPYLNLFCCIATAVVFSAIVFLVYKKYNLLMAICFFVTFLLSPYLVNFARNLYWVEFTWFLPMLIGLVCSLTIRMRKYRIISYIIAFIAIMIKCLCGYEFISTIMMSLVSFLIADFFKSMISKDKKQMLLVFRTTVIIGCSALLGFVMAIFIHANIRGDGNILEGIQSIIDEDVFRRTFGGDLNKFDEVYWPSFNASIWEVYSRYFHFPANIITGIMGNMFSVLCITPIAIFVYNYIKKKIITQEAFLYIAFFLTSVSWFILGKAHSYIHMHLNYVLWYFGYVQICIYIICRQIADFINSSAIENKN